MTTTTTTPTPAPAPMTAEQIDRLRVIVQGITPGLDRDMFEKLLRCIDALTARVATLESKLAAARKVPSDDAVRTVVEELRAFGQPWYIEIADLLTRLSAALKEAERKSVANADHARLANRARDDAARCAAGNLARAQAAEAKLESARRDALEEAASLAAEYGRAISKGLRRSAGPNDTGEQIAEAIRALQTKDTTP